MNTKIYKSKFTKVLLATTLLAGTFLPFASTVNAKSTTNGRTEYYGKAIKSSNAKRATSDEYLALGAECTATVNIKGNKGNKNIRSNMKNSVKLKGTKGTNTGNDICTYAQKDIGFKINYDKSGRGVVWFDKQSFAFVKHQGYKKIYTVRGLSKKLQNKYQKLGLLSKGDDEMKIIITVNVKNPNLIKKPRYKIAKNYVRTSSISSKNVLINNVSYDDGSDTLTVKGLKKGTRLNIYHGSGELYKSVVVNSTSYKVTVPRNSDIQKEFYSAFYKSGEYKNKTTDKIIISRTEPNKHESYRLQYKIPEEKVSNKTPSGHSSTIKELGTAGASITVFSMQGESQVTIQFPSLIGNKEGVYRIKYDGKEVYKFNVSSSDYDDIGNGDYLYYKEFTNDTQAVNTFKNLQPKNLADAKKYTITAQIDGKEESLPVPFYVKNSETNDYNIGYVIYIQE